MALATRSIAVLSGVEERDADRVDVDRFAQRVEVALDAVVAGLAGERLEVDGNLGGEDVETDRGTTAAAEDDLRGQEIRAFLLVAAFGCGTGHRVVSGPLSLSRLSVSVLRGRIAELIHSSVCLSRRQLRRILTYAVRNAS